MEATKVGIREFRSAITEYIASGTPIAITRHGLTVGFFIPAGGQAAADVAALHEASAVLDRLLVARGVEVEVIAKDFNFARKARARRKLAIPRAA